MYVDGRYIRKKRREYFPSAQSWKTFLAVNQQVFCAFVDFKKAFDRVVRMKLWDLYSVSGRVRSRKGAAGYKSLYRGHSACVQLGFTSNRVLNKDAPCQLGCSICIWIAVSKE